MTPYVPQPQRGSSVKNGLFRKDEFRYDAARDVYVCPAGEALSRNHESTLRDLKRFHYTNPASRQPSFPAEMRETRPCAWGVTEKWRANAVSTRSASNMLIKMPVDLRRFFWCRNQVQNVPMRLFFPRLPAEHCAQVRIRLEAGSPWPPVGIIAESSRKSTLRT